LEAWNQHNIPHLLHMM